MSDQPPRRSTRPQNDVETARDHIDAAVVLLEHLPPSTAATNTIVKLLEASFWAGKIP